MTINQPARMLCALFWIGSLVPTATPSLMAFQTRTQPPNWGDVIDLAPGAEVKVVVKQGHAQRGTFQSATADAITVHIATGDQSLARADVAQILAKSRGHRAKHALIGLAIGGGVGLTVGAVADHSNSKSNQWDILPNAGKAILTTLGVLVGAGIGALLPAGGWKTIYKSS